MELKNVHFRAWDKTNMEMHTFSLERILCHNKPQDGFATDGTVEFMIALASHGCCSAFEMMLGSGVMDNFGAEIFAGDIVYSELYKQNVLVRYKEGLFGIDCEGGFMPIRTAMISKVVGNVYQHPALITEPAVSINMLAPVTAEANEIL